MCDQAASRFLQMTGCKDGAIRANDQQRRSIVVGKMRFSGKAHAFADIAFGLRLGSNAKTLPDHSKMPMLGVGCAPQRERA